MTAYVLLCRHGSHNAGELLPIDAIDTSGTSAASQAARASVEGSPSVPNSYPIDVVGARLSEELSRIAPPGRSPIKVHAIRCADSPEASATLRRLVASLGWTVGFGAGQSSTTGRAEAIATTALPVLKAGMDQPRDDVDELASVLRECAQTTSVGGGNAVLVVGHQPVIGRVADALLRPRSRWRRLLFGAPNTPIDKSGIVCVAMDSAARPLERANWIAWAISYDDASAADAVRDKVSRKLDIAKVFGGVLTLGLPLILGVLFDRAQFDGLGGRQWAVQIGTGLYLVAAALFLATMFAYDSLLMPQRFWGETAAGARRKRHRRWLVERPPSSAAWVLYQNMMRIWRNLFTVAAVVAFLGTALLSFAALRVDHRVVIAASAATAVALGWWLRWSRPVLGSED
jgi:hypothetical protein